MTTAQIRHVTLPGAIASEAVSLPRAPWEPAESAIVSLRQESEPRRRGIMQHPTRKDRAKPLEDVE